MQPERLPSEVQPPEWRGASAYHDRGTRGAPPRTTTRVLPVAQRLGIIDVFRGIAALLVLLYHARQHFWVGMRAYFASGPAALHPTTLAAFLSSPLLFGFLGVQLLFVVSGYCIHRAAATRIARGERGMPSVGEYYRRRCARIYPTLVAALMLTFVLDTMAARLGHGSNGANLDGRTAIVNLLALQGLAGPMFGSNSVLWSLSIEIHLYLVYPLLLFLRTRIGMRLLLGAAFVVSAAYAVAITYFVSPTALPFVEVGHPVFVLYLFTWLSGAYLAEVEAGLAHLPRYFAPAALIAGVSGVALCLLDRRHLAEPLWGVALGGVVALGLFAGAGGYRLRRLPSVLAGVGLMSYSLYIVHVPVLRALKAFGLQVSSGFGSAGVAVLVALAIAWLMFQLVESWSLRARPFALLVPTWRARIARDARSHEGALAHPVGSTGVQSGH